MMYKLYMIYTVYIYTYIYYIYMIYISIIYISYIMRNSLNWMWISPTCSQCYSATSIAGCMQVWYREITTACARGQGASFHVISTERELSIAKGLGDPQKGNGSPFKLVHLDLLLSDFGSKFCPRDPQRLFFLTHAHVWAAIYTADSERSGHHIVRVNRSECPSARLDRP